MDVCLHVMNIKVTEIHKTPNKWLKYVWCSVE
jgi:hypothetical protein